MRAHHLSEQPREGCPELPDFEREAGLVEISDTVRANAYESLPAPLRAWIKTTLALVRSVHGERPQEQSRRSVQAALGFTDEWNARAADWVLCVPGSDFASAPRLAAAVACARLAGLDAVAAVWPEIDPAACSPQLLTALELCGVDMAYTLAKAAAPATTWARVTDALVRTVGPSGRVLYFGRDDDTSAALFTLARARHIPLWRDDPPRVVLTPDYPGDPDIIRWAHPDARPGHANDMDAVIYASDDLPRTGRLRLGPGLEGCWLPPDLSPDFFRDVRFGLDKKNAE